MENEEISIVKPDDRTGDGNLLPETRERTIKSIRSYLKRRGYLNVSDLAAELCLSRQTTKKLAKQVIEEWRENEIDQSAIIVKWLEWVAKDIDCNPDSFDKEKIALINLKLTILGKINTLRRTSSKENKPKHDLVNLSLIGINMKRIKAPEIELRSEENKN